MGHAGLIIKGTRLCNLRCAYCHDWRAGRDQSMSFPVMARLIATALRDPEHDAIDFIWHGGETTLLPQAFYEKAMYVQSRFRRPGQVICNSIQTNGTRLTPAWARFLRANRFSVGVSIDGPPEVHDRVRRYASGRPSSADVARGIRLLREYGVPFSVLMVIDAEALALGPDRVFDFFLEHDIKNYAVLAAKPDNDPDAPPGTPATHYTDPARMAAFLTRLYDRWLEHGDPDIQIRELDGIRRRLTGARAGFCTLAGGCLGKYYLIEPNGDVAHCDLFLGDARYTLGNILTHDFAALRGGAPLRALQAENERALDAMRACPDFALCNGWCPHERYLSARHNPMHEAGCCGLRDLIAHIRRRIPEERDDLVVLSAS
jgi:uncharacterized protein